jgi:hypothetical protein
MRQLLSFNRNRQETGCEDPPTAAPVGFARPLNPPCLVEIGGEVADVGNLSADTLIRIVREASRFSGEANPSIADMIRIASIAAGESNEKITAAFIAARPLPEAVAFSRFVTRQAVAQFGEALSKETQRTPAGGSS